eukprot:GHUV01027386.1.p3 GENE.GHUV01027386.1~~GHUV01027386.1.p3  ORF type:complete len:102 (+),score=15.96 GHUV01027386.1:480-785(+)
MSHGRSRQISERSMWQCPGNFCSMLVSGAGSSSITCISMLCSHCRVVDVRCKYKLRKQPWMNMNRWSICLHLSFPQYLLADTSIKPSSLQQHTQDAHFLAS